MADRTAQTDGASEDDRRAPAIERLERVLGIRPSHGAGVPVEDPSDAVTRFLGAENFAIPTRRVYGGQVLAQSVLAAAATVDPSRLPHSLHAYFLRGGALDQQIEFDVHRLRDGRSFSQRSVNAVQDGGPILSLIASFQKRQDGLDFALPMPDVPEPDAIPSQAELLEGYDNDWSRYLSEGTPFEVRHVQQDLYLGPDKARADEQFVWVRAKGDISLAIPGVGEQAVQRALLACACDQLMMEPVLRQGGVSWITPGIAFASLDHAMWWHRDVDMREWHLFAQQSPSAQGGRGLGIARIYSAGGELVSTIAQEAMIRVPPEAIPPSTR